MLISLYYFYDYVESFEVYYGKNYVVGTQAYSNGHYSFEFPENWSYQEFDTFVSLYDENHDFVASINYPHIYDLDPMGSDKESYEKHFKIHGLDDFEIIELSYLKIDGYDADKIILKSKIGWREFLYLKYNIDVVPRLTLGGQHPTTKAKHLFPQLEKIFNSLRFTVD